MNYVDMLTLHMFSNVGRLLETDHDLDPSTVESDEARIPGSNSIYMMECIHSKLFGLLFLQIQNYHVDVFKTL